MELLLGAVAIGTNSLAVLGLAYRAGRLVTKLEQAEKRIADLEESKTDVAIAKVGEQVNGLKGEMSQLRDEFREEMRSWRNTWQAKAAGAGAHT